MGGVLLIGVMTGFVAPHVSLTMEALVLFAAISIVTEKENSQIVAMTLSVGLRYQTNALTITNQFIDEILGLHFNFITF